MLLLLFSFLAHGSMSSEYLILLPRGSVSGVTPEDPAVSRKSGLLFERSLFLKHLAVMLCGAMRIVLYFVFFLFFAY